MKKVSVIIPNYNGDNYIKQCFESLKRQEYKDFDIIFVDNCSEDGGIETARKYDEGLEVNYIQLDFNYGFSRAVNEGIKSSDAQYVILLNNDTKAAKHFVGALVGAMDGQDDVFSGQAKMLCYDDAAVVDDAGDFFCILGWAYGRGKDKKAANYNRQDEIFSACAGAAIYRRDVFDKIGYFDEHFFAYLEDVDIGYRAKLYGYKNIFIPTARVLHMGSATSGSRHNSFKVKLAARNSIFVMYKNFAPWQKVVNFLPVCAGCLIKWVYFLKKGLGADYAKGVMEGIKKRKRLDAVNDSEISDGTYGNIQIELMKNLLGRLGE